MNNRANGGRASRKIIFNYNFFNELTDKTAYWAGFLMADGCLQDVIWRGRRSNRLQLGLAEMDKDHIFRFCDDIGCDKNFIHYVKTIKGQNQLKVSLSYNGISDSLLKWGIIPNKTYNYVEPKIPDELIPHYLRGWFDGDGNITKSRFRITGNKFALKWYAESLVRLGFDRKISFEKLSNENQVWSRLYTDGKESLQNILSIIKSNEELKLKRKYNESY